MTVFPVLQPLTRGDHPGGGLLQEWKDVRRDRLRGSAVMFSVFDARESLRGVGRVLEGRGGGESRAVTGSRRNGWLRDGAVSWRDAGQSWEGASF